VVLDPEHIYEQALSFAVFIVAEQTGVAASGSGFAVAKGWIATNWHVVEGSQAVQVRFADSTQARARVAWHDPSDDLALLRVAPWPSQFSEAILASWETAAPGQAVYALGAPLGLRWTFTSGIISARRPSEMGPPAIQTDVAISPGSSGGPLMDRCGRVVGVITFRVIDEGAENLSFARPVDRLVSGISAVGAWP
jgi:serine protease Do